MTRRYAILCPGQGAQHPAMFAMTPEAVVPVDLAGDLFANQTAQPLIVAVGLARWQALRASTSLLPSPSLVAGYSVGELTAYGVAGALPAGALITLAAERARLMDTCVDPADPHCMLAISGLAQDRLLPLLQAHGLTVAIDNGIDRIVAGGLQRDCGDLVERLGQLGAQCQRLPVAVASHTPLMRAAGASFAALLATQSWAHGTPVLAGTTARKVATAGLAQAALVAQLSQTIAWAACMDALVENGIGVTLELGPGDALSRMMRTRHPSVDSRAIDDFRSIDGASKWLLRQLD